MLNVGFNFNCKEQESGFCHQERESDGKEAGKGDRNRKI